MTPLLRYVFLKNARERLLIPMVIAPALLVGAPLAGLLIRNLFRGKPLHPFALDGVQSWISIFVFASFAAMFAAAAAGIAAFWIFRDEIIDGSVSAFILATRPIRISWTALVCGLSAGTASFLLALSVIALLTWSVPPRLGVLWAAFLGTAALATALAVLLAAISPEPGMLFPMFVIAGPVGIALLTRVTQVWAFVAALVIVLPVVAGLVLERRCAG